jgi:alanyl-tRNA synthetase
MAANSAPQVPTTAPAAWPEPQNWSAEKVRKTYIDYFQNQPGYEHTFWPSSGVIPFDDDTLLFANAVSCPMEGHGFCLTCRV